eukprot:6387928-Ditylum_brightwellii.AAC.2
MDGVDKNIFGNGECGVIFGGAMRWGKSLTRCAMDGAGTQFCVCSGTLDCLEGCVIWGLGVITNRGDTNGVMLGEGVTLGSDAGLVAMVDEGFCEFGVVYGSTLGSGAGGTL